MFDLGVFLLKMVPKHPKSQNMSRGGGKGGEVW